MRKNILFLFIFLLCLCLVGCGRNNSDIVLKDFEKKIKGLDSYKLCGNLEITNNDDTYKYSVDVAYKKENKYRVSLINKSNDYEQVILKNSDGVFVVTPSLNKSFKFQSEWPNNTSQIYLLHSILKDLKNYDKKEFAEKGGKYIFTTKVNYPNNSELVTQKIVFNKDLTIESIEVMNSDKIPQMVMTIKSIDYDYNYKDSYFELSDIISNIDTEKETKDDEKKATEQTIGGINDVIYPLYIPTGTKLTNQEKLSTDFGERVILTFDGEKPFLLVEENSGKYSEFNIIPTFGEPYFLTDTIAALTKNSISWTSNGLDYYIVSDVMSQGELIEVAGSISAIPTIK